MPAYIPLAKDEEVSLARAALAGSARARDRLILSHRFLAEAVARKLRRPDLFDDLVAEGMIGLCKAAERFDPELGFRFSTYAKIWIRATINDYLLYQSGAISLPSNNSVRRLFSHYSRLKSRAIDRGMTLSEINLMIAETLQVPLSLVESYAISRRQVSFDEPTGLSSPVTETIGDMIPDDTPGPEALFLLDETDRVAAGKLAAVLPTLTERHQAVIRLRYLSDPRATLDVLGKTFGVTRERARQIELSALTILAKRLGGKYVPRSNRVIAKSGNIDVDKLFSATAKTD